MNERPERASRSAAGRQDLAAAQEELVRALVAGGALPDGFDAVRVDVASRALLNKRSGEVAGAWPRLAAAYGNRWRAEFAAWAAGRPTRGSWRDGWDFARDHRDTLPPEALFQMELNEARWSYDGESPPRPRRAGLRRASGCVIVNLFGGIRVIGRPPVT